MSKLKDGCVKPAVGPITDQESASTAPDQAKRVQEVKKVLAKVGQKAIDFQASAFVAGQGFKPVKLSDYKGKWIVICFYPGDFTYV